MLTWGVGGVQQSHLERVKVDHVRDVPNQAGSAADVTYKTSRVDSDFVWRCSSSRYVLKPSWYKSSGGNEYSFRFFTLLVLRNGHAEA